MNKQLVLLGVIALASTYLFVTTLKQQNSTPALSAYSQEIYDAFSAWQAKYGVKYDDPDIAWYRTTVFATNYEFVKSENAAQDDVVYGQNQFMAMTTEEFQKAYLGYFKKDTHDYRTIDEQDLHTGRLGGDEIDWTAKGAVTKVKDQGQCGSCWAFSTTGSLESALFLAGKGLNLLSEQQLVDCSSKYGNQGCNGGLMDNGFNYIKDNGITTEDKYPYKAVTQKCKQNSGEFKLTSYTDIPAGNVTALAEAVKKQPVSIAVDAESWQFYQGGILKSCGTSLDHGVLLVGYNNASWKVKNSWGPSWGEEGFIRLKRGNTCGLANAASVPVV